MARSTDLERTMREHIVRGVFAPTSRLRMEDLKARFDVGYSPIRETLSRLIGEGLVEFEPNRGFRVAALSKDDLEDIAVARIAIERAAIRRAIERGDDSWEAGILAALHRYSRKSETAFSSDESLVAWEHAHDELHAALIAACASPRLMAEQKRLQEQHLRYRKLIVVPRVPFEAHVEEHKRLATLALDRDSDGAAEHIERHMMITVDALRDAEFWETAGTKTE